MLRRSCLVLHLGAKPIGINGHSNFQRTAPYSKSMPCNQQNITHRTKTTRSNIIIHLCSLLGGGHLEPLDESQIGFISPFSFAFHQIKQWLSAAISSSRLR